MATAKSTPTEEITEIQRRMAQVRHEHPRGGPRGGQGRAIVDRLAESGAKPSVAGAGRGGGGGLPDRAAAAPGTGADDRGGRPARGEPGAAAEPAAPAAPSEAAMGTDRLGAGPAGPDRRAGRAELRHPVSRAVDRRAAARRAGSALFGSGASAGAATRRRRRPRCAALRGRPVRPAGPAKLDDPSIAVGPAAQGRTQAWMTRFNPSMRDPR